MDIILEFLLSRWFWIPLVFFIGYTLHKWGLDILIFEGKNDERPVQIPDEDIKILWEELSDFNLQIGFYYSQIIGPYFMILALLNGIILLLFGWDIPPQLLGKTSLVIICGLLALAFYLINFGAVEVFDKARGNFIGLDIKVFKRSLYSLYEEINFSSRFSNTLTKSQKKHTVRQICQMIQMSNHMKLGAVIWYVLWMSIGIYTTIKIIIFNL
ncbi:hypothetical protein OXI21_01175 [Ignatzschineria sp. RMDPL8A]|uniref:hypothetical protein n=1 Tax=Ignatzschineria sp. RMDPL8A TaxID=2999236 RepID=UPI0024467346|nr:hypothetical protein [Ignatzschineria sp. RMDPL8A]MDG9729038.1 hypothetical protein [Ignatzschineria sp. RMDPL8A]